MSTDLDEEDAVTDVEILTEELPDVPGYLHLVNKDIKDEARRAFALTFVISDTGVLHPEWLGVLHSITEYLKNGHLPTVAEIRSIKAKQPRKITDHDE